MTQHLAARTLQGKQTPDLIIDGRLALSEHGLMLALALAARRAVWLVPGLWALLQRFEVIDYPDFADPDEDVEAMLPTLREWHAVWSGTQLLERFYWVGDVLFESRLPPDFDQSAARRLQGFALTLERFAESHGPLSAMTVCARDAAALAAVKAVDAPVILTEMRAAARPRLCDFLAAGGVGAREIDGLAAQRLRRSALGQTPPAGAELALACGVQVAAVSLLAPRAIAAALEPESDFEPDDVIYSEERDPWRGAQAVWCEVAL